MHERIALYLASFPERERASALIRLRSSLRALVERSERWSIDPVSVPEDIQLTICGREVLMALSAAFLAPPSDAAVSDLTDDLSHAMRACLVNRSSDTFGEVELVLALASLAGAAARAVGRDGVGAVLGSVMMLIASTDDEERAVAAVREAFATRAKGLIATMATAPGGKG